ncbi:hypothetical protein D8B46_08865 [Candidatus Gracilibacteria bacterium]|nr:MAG: hypothetical protein D8B46_08865 [Candidatus Gracilibacteria bacterium]
MKNRFLLKILAFFAMFLFIIPAFADKGLKVDEKTSDSVKLSWDKDEKADYYQINYGEKPTTSAKPTGQTETLQTTSTEITGLTGTKYYFSLVGMNSDGGEIFKSKDLEVNLADDTKTSSDVFSITKSKLVEKNVLEITFSKNLDSKKLEDAEFKIEAVNDSSDYLKVKSVKAVAGDPKTVRVEFDGTPTDKVEYKVVVLAIFDEKGSNIKFGVDSETKFVGGELDKEVIVTNTKADDSKATDTKKEDLNSAGPSTGKTEEQTKTEDKTEKTTTKKELKGESGKKEDTGKNVEAISENKEKLPQTGPETIIIIVVALLATAGFFALRK